MMAVMLETPLASGKTFEAKVQEIVPGLGVGRDIVGNWVVFHLPSGRDCSPGHRGFRTRADAKQWAKDLAEYEADWTESAEAIMQADSRHAEAYKRTRRRWDCSGWWPRRYMP